MQLWKWKIPFLSSTILLFLILSGCASSDVSRSLTCGVDAGVSNVRSISEGVTDGSIADTYGNASQMEKGALVGGAAGAVAGASAATGIGILPGAAIGAVIGASYGKYVDTKTDLKDRIENRGGTIVILGDQILIVIPSDRLFKCNSAYVKPQAYSTLCLVTQFINCFVKMMVRIAAYTGDTGTKCLDISLSKQQAQRVAKLLLESGLDTRVLYAEGMGATSLVTNNCNGWGSPNYRIEITLEKQYV